MVPTREHVVFDLIWNSVSARVKRGMSIVGNLMIAGLSLVAIPASWDYVQFMGREHTPVLDWSLQWVYFPFVVLLVALSWRSVVAVIQAVQKDERSEQESRS
jgi:TRAP-type C4-dicarboxylate transport system permease small subunit